jgi:hypothetical protein
MRQISHLLASRAGLVAFGLLLLLLSVPALIPLVLAVQEGPSGPDTPITSDTAAPGPSATAARGITGLVQAPDGSPVPDVFVAPESLASPPVLLPEIAIVTDRQGVYHWDLPPGPYRLTFTAAGYAATSAHVVVPTAGAARLDVTLSPT